MIPQTNVCVLPSRAAQFRSSVEQLLIDGKPVSFDEREDGFFSISLGYRNIHERRQTAQVNGRPVPFADLGLSILRIDDKCGATAYHVPSGSLLIYDGRASAGAPSGQTTRPQISTRDIAPAILRNFSLPIPDYMIRTPLVVERNAA
jgi:hypothetical protein